MLYYWSFPDTSNIISITLPSADETTLENSTSDDNIKETADTKESKKPLLCWFDGLIIKNMESDVIDNNGGDDETFGLVPEVLLSRTRINASKLTRDGEYAEAVNEKIRAVALSRIIYGDISVQIARAYVELAEGYLKLRKLPLQAIKHSEFSRDILLEIESSRCCENPASENRVETAAVLELIYFVLGKANKMLKNYRKADNLLQKAHLVQTKKANDCGASVLDTYKTLETLVLLGEVSRLRKQHGHAMEWFEKAVELVEIKLGSDSGELVGLYHQIGRTELQLGKHANFQRVYESYEKARKLASHRYGKMSSEYAGSCLSLARAYLIEKNRMQFSQAETALDEAILIYTSVYGASHSKTLSAQEELCQLFLQDRKYTEAEAKLNSLIKGKLVKYGEISEPVADTYKTLGGLFLTQNKYELAIHNLMKSMEIYRVVLGPQNRKTRGLSKVIESIKKSPASSKLNIPEHKLKDRPRFNNTVSGPKTFVFTKTD